MLTIGKLAKEVHIGVETVRYYQRKGLIQVPQKTERQVITWSPGWT